MGYSLDAVSIPEAKVKIRYNTTLWKALFQQWASIKDFLRR
jgi:hypothetical protein